MIAPSRPVRMLIGSLGVFLLAPAVVTLLATAFGHQLPGSTLLGAALAFLIAAGYVWFWFFARDERTRLLIGALVVLLTCVSSVLPESPLVLFFWAYPALLIGFALRPLRAIVATVILILLAFGLAILHSLQVGDAATFGIGTGLRILGILVLASWGSITVAQLIWNNADLHAAREELARMAVEEERARFARDLHDLLGHTLSLIVVKMQLAGRLLPDPSSPAAVELKEVEALARNALQDVREVAGGYRQLTLASELAGAGVALEAAGIKLTVLKDVGVLPPEVEATLAWTVREGVTNAVRHSAASTCRVEIRQDAEAVTIAVIDDGHGPLGSASGMGLSGLSERVEARGGSVEWTQPGLKGFSLSARIPLGPAMPAAHSQKARAS